MQRIFQFRTCSLDIDADDQRWRWFRPCLLHSIRQCTAPCNFRVTKEEYRKQIRALAAGAGRQERPSCSREMEQEMQEASAALQFEKAARLRDEIDALQKLGLRGDVDKDVQPEVFQIDPKKGLRRPAQGARAGADAADHRGRGHRPPGRRGDGGVAGVVHRRPAVQAGLSPLPDQDRCEGVDDFASIREVVSRRFRRLSQRGRASFPDILLIDGGKGQLNAALEAFRMLGIEPPCLISLAKREEEIYRPGEAEPLRLSRHAAALRLLQYVRDEAHRFAQHYHHMLRRKKLQGVNELSDGR